jgi:hypothetical protein
MKSAFVFLMACVATLVAAEDFMVFNTTSSTGSPGNFSDGLYTLLPAEDKSHNGVFSGSYLLCSSCTVSYMFGTKTVDMKDGEEETIIFRDNTMEPIPVTFFSVDLELEVYDGVSIDSAKSTLTVTSKIALVDPQYMTDRYFNMYEPVLSLAPV